MRYSRILALATLCAALSLSALAQRQDSESARDDAAIATLQPKDNAQQQRAEADIAAVTGDSKPADAAQPTASKPEAAQPAAESAPVVTPAPAPVEASAPTLRQRPTADASILVPVGTALRVTLKKQISTVDAAPGQSFEAVVREDVKVNGKVVIPSGATLSGRIAHLAEPRRISGRPWIQLQPESVQLADGRTVNLRAIAVDTAEPKRYEVNDEGRIKGPTFTRADKITGVATAGAGVIAGTIVAGAEGGLIGVGAAAGFTAGKWLVTRHSMTLPETLVIILEVSEPIREPQTLAQAIVK